MKTIGPYLGPDPGRMIFTGVEYEVHQLGKKVNEIIAALNELIEGAKSYPSPVVEAVAEAPRRLWWCNCGDKPMRIPHKCSDCGGEEVKE